MEVGGGEKRGEISPTIAATSTESISADHCDENLRFRFRNLVALELVWVYVASDTDSDSGCENTICHSLRRSKSSGGAYPEVMICCLLPAAR